MPAKPVDITNIRFGRLVALRPVGKASSRNILWLCQCDCGNQSIVSTGDLRRKNRPTKSCDRSDECRAGRNYKHGESYFGPNPSPEYRAWRAMHSRCENPNVRNYKDYGGRGITVDPKWNNFVTFLADVGRRPHPELSLDRINNDKGYFPGNTRWATRSQQRRNRRDHG